MSLLDKFRAVPRDKHPDPVVRLAHVAEIPLDDKATIADMAREDEDPRVRRAAVAKLMDPGALGRIAREDADESVRTQAAGMLRDIALEAFEGLGEAEALAAVDAMDDGRARVQVAKTATRDAVALRAFSGPTDAHALGAIARHAVAEGARRSAFARLQEQGDRAEILGVAMNGEHKDTALAAVDILVDDRAVLEQVAERSKNKAAAKRARAIVREADEQAARVAAEAAARAAALDSQFVAEADSAAEPPPPLASVVRVVEVEEVRVEIEDEAAQRAAAEAEAVRQSQEAEARHTALMGLIDRMAAASTETDLASARQQFGAARREWRDVAAGHPVDAALAERFAQLDAVIHGREQDARAADQQVRQEALTRLKSLLGRIEPLAEKADLSLKAAERAARELRTVLSALPSLPTRQDAEEISRRLKAAQATLNGKLQELRDADEWKRWANAGIQEQLCVKMEALQAVEDLETVARTVRTLQEEWRNAADVPRAQADVLWRRFKAAHDAVWPRCEAHFAAEAQTRAENLAKKTALCDKAAELALSSNWLQTAEAIKVLQAEWKTIGAVPRGHEKALWERFRTACDQFFTRRQEDLASRKAVWAENLARKTALCEQVEVLATSSEWDQAAAEIKRLQAEWKLVGPVKKSRSDVIWQRFRAACDQFFARYAQRHEMARGERAAAREGLCAELEALLAPPASEEAAVPDGVADTAAGAVGAVGTAPPADLLATVRTIRSRWQQEIAARGVEPARARALDERYAAAQGGVVARWPEVFAGTDLDPDANRRRMEALVNRVEDLAKSLAGSAVAKADGALSPTSRLASMLKEALASNTIGGKVDDDSRWRAAAEDVRRAQGEWARLGVVGDAPRRQLTDRFQRACRLILDKATGSAGATGGGTAAGRASTAR